jgi:hypothetical protein
MSAGLHRSLEGAMAHTFIDRQLCHKIRGPRSYSKRTIELQNCDKAMILGRHFQLTSRHFGTGGNKIVFTGRNFEPAHAFDLRP